MFSKRKQWSLRLVSATVSFSVTGAKSVCSFLSGTSYSLRKFATLRTCDGIFDLSLVLLLLQTNDTRSDSTYWSAVGSSRNKTAYAPTSAFRLAKAVSIKCALRIEVMAVNQFTVIDVLSANYSPSRSREFHQSLWWRGRESERGRVR